ncbi:CD209 antigen-like protein C [Channa argus]|uniref:CD209 antigen-like protein C n=1 Tax=Channa argus TaxID=215402 RepID=UPI00352271B7
MEEVYVNVEYDKSVHSRPSTDQKGPSRCHGPAVLCLGLLSVFLLAGLIVLSVHYYNSVLGAAAELSTIKNNLTERLQDAKNKVSSLTKERNQLNASIIQMTEERKKLQKKPCPTGWTVSSCSCYYLSAESGSWKKGGADCENQGAHLVVIDTAVEQNFLSGFTNVSAWIGLSDIDEEGTWKWIDGSPLTLKSWVENQPDNGGKHETTEEDCAHIREHTAEWNDLPCETFLRWICEKKVQHC